MFDSSLKAYDAILNNVSNPSTYLGNEANSVHKDYANVTGSMALVFPDLYEIGMSHLGLKILYKAVNKEPDLAAERAFAPKDDFAEAIISAGLPLMSLESKRPLKSFDIVGFTIPYELSYTTILWILDLAGIPLHAKDRTGDHPFIVGGGAGVYNPEPIARFFDFFAMGDGEELTVEILRKVLSLRGIERPEALKELARIPGVYVPSLFDVTYKNDGALEAITPHADCPESARRIFIPGLNESSFPCDMVAPFHTTQDRLTVELDRGCVQGCRFCQAGSTYRPARERTPDEVISLVDKAIKETGYGEVSLTSLSAGDYTQIEPLLTALMDKHEAQRISISLPSLRPATITMGMIQAIGRVRKSGFTISSEAGSERLRNVINKKVCDEDIIRVATDLLTEGWRSLKLYFMLGLPTETDEDVDAIYDLAQRLTRLNVNGNKYMNINVSASNFVPKAHTAFQWMGQDKMELLVHKKERLLKLIKQNKRLRLKWNNPKLSHLEAVFSRGDRRLAIVVEAAYRMGARLDAWSERFDYSLWQLAFASCGLQSSDFANKDFDLNDTLPWDHIDTGITKKFLKREYQAAFKDEMTGDCKTENCLACGLDPKQCFEKYQWEAPEITDLRKAEGDTRYKYRLVFEKMGLSRFISHLEFQSVMLRALRMIEAPVLYSRGFSPSPKISFGGALGVGVESQEEYIDLELYEEQDEAKFIGALNETTPGGVRFKSCALLPVGAKSVSALTAGAEYEITLNEEIDETRARKAVQHFNDSHTHMVTRSGKKNKVFDLRPMIENLAYYHDTRSIRFHLMVVNKSTAKPKEVYAAIFGEDAPPVARIVKQTLILAG